MAVGGWYYAKFHHRRSHHVSPRDQQAVSNPDLFLPRNLINHASKQKVSGPHFMCLINHVSSHNQQSVSVSASFICQEVSSIMSYPTTNRKWVTLLPVFAGQSCQSIMSHPMTNSKWVTLFHLFPRQSHQSCLIPWPTAGGWHCFMHSCQAVSSIMLHPMTNSKWVKLPHLPLARQSHQSCRIPWWTVSEWHCFICLPGILIDYLSSHDQQEVNVTPSFVCLAFSSIISHPMTNSL